jgi:hypothetical protein
MLGYLSMIPRQHFMAFFLDCSRLYFLRIPAHQVGVDARQERIQRGTVKRGGAAVTGTGISARHGTLPPIGHVRSGTSLDSRVAQLRKLETQK